MRDISHAPLGLCIAATLSVAAHPALAKDDSDFAAPTAPEQDSTSAQSDSRSYLPTDFAQFAPRNANDMLSQVPGFSIRGDFNVNRGLGQATANVLINGERLSGKSESASDQLSRIPADKVVRIEILDGSSLDIPGLTGQVANVVIRSSGISGQFEWEPQLPTKYAAFRWSQGEVSVSGDAGLMDYTIALSNQPFRGGSGGPTRITNAQNDLIEQREGATRTANDAPKVSGQFRFGLPNDMVANLNLSYRWNRSDFKLDEIRSGDAIPDTDYLFVNRNRGHEYEVGGDVEFALGPGRLKLVGLEAYNTSDRSSRERFDFADGTDSTGSLFTLVSDSGERIMRGEYSWGLWGADWQLSGEAAFNRLDNMAGLFTLDPVSDDFVEIPFPAGTGGVTEDRYETLLSYGRPISSTLTLQMIAGGESSRIAQSGVGATERSFKRPKGSLSLAWAPSADFDVTFKVARDVGQLNFSDFLADVNLANDNANASNNQLVPEQSWLFESISNKDFGPWGSASLRLFFRQIEDLVTIVPLAGGQEGVGNVDSARRFGLGLNGTLNFDPIGFSGAKIDINLQLRDSHVTDPVTGEDRPLDRLNGRFVTADFRHDIPNTDLAWGMFVRNTQFGRYNRVAETGKDNDVTTFGAIYAEHKDVFGLTVRARMANIFNGSSSLRRTVYGGPRHVSPILFNEDRSRKIGLVWNFSVKGNF